jgi:hypothetical protein
VGHWLASAGPAIKPTIARAIMRFFIQITSLRRQGHDHRVLNCLLEQPTAAVHTGKPGYDAMLREYLFGKWTGRRPRLQWPRLPVLRESGTHK